MSSLAKSYEPKLVEEKLLSFWEEGGFAHADVKSGKPPYCIVIPPPNVTGVLHMGHALVNTVQDILIRYKRMQGFEALWVPGTDHAGIATQAVVERQLLKETGKRRSDFSREEFLERVWKWKEVCEGRILSQLRVLGCSCDWKRLRFTMDEGCNAAVRHVFSKMYEDGLIYLGDYLVNWDPVAQTALSDDEVEHEERDSFLWHIRYPLSEGEGHLVVATTRPETMLGDSAVAVHPEDERYRTFIGKYVRLPFVHRLIPVIADPFVERGFGSGAVKITPAHDFNDYEMARRHCLPMINILTKDGKINEQGGVFEGLSVDKAREKIVEKLKQEGLLEKLEPHKLRVGVSYRSKAVIQPYLSKQWFVRMSGFKDKLLAIVREDKVKLVPAHWKETYEHWINNLRDWCISRQLWWGHRIPIWYDKNNRKNMICFAGDGVPPEVAKDPERWEQDQDVLDTWFSSALWPFSVLGWPQKTEELRRFYPTSTLVTGHDILFFWVARMILMGDYVMHEVPFKETFLHGLIYGKSYWRRDHQGALLYVDAEEKKRYDLGEKVPGDVESKWEKMSKSKGNVLDPLELIQEYGTDALRMALASSVTHARQIDLDLRRFEEYKNFANKLWNGSRFVFLNIEDLDLKAFEETLDAHSLVLEDRWMLSIVNRTIEELTKSLEHYHFDRASVRAYEFFWNDFCAIYVEISKPVLFGKIGTPTQRIVKQKLLAILLCIAIRLLHPIAPFITEEIFSLLKEKFPVLPPIHGSDAYTKDFLQALSSKACMVAPYPKVLCHEHISLESEQEFTGVLQMVHAVRQIRAAMQLPPSEKSELFVCKKLSSEQQKILLAILPLSLLHGDAKEHELPSFGASELVDGVKIFVPIPEFLKAKERARLLKEQEKLEKLLATTKVKLDNAEFRARASPELVHNLEKTLLQTEEKLMELHKQLTSET